MMVRTVGILACVALACGAMLASLAPEAPARPLATTAVAGVLREHARETTGILEKAVPSVANAVWIAMGEEELVRAQAALDRELPTQAVRPAILARWLLKVAAEVDLADPREPSAGVDASRERLDRAATRIDLVRSQVADDGVVPLVLAEQYFAKAVEDFGFLAEMDRSLAGPRTQASMRDRAVTILAVDADLDLVEALVEEADRRRGPRAIALSGVEEAVLHAEAASARLPTEAESGKATLSSYYLAKHRFPQYMRLLLERGWTEGALWMAHETELNARVHEQANGSLPSAEDLSTLVEALAAKGGPFSEIHRERAQFLLLDLGGAPDRLKG